MDNITFKLLPNDTAALCVDGTPIDLSLEDIRAMNQMVTEEIDLQILKELRYVNDMHRGLS